MQNHPLPPNHQSNLKIQSGLLPVRFELYPQNETPFAIQSKPLEEEDLSWGIETKIPGVPSHPAGAAVLPAGPDLCATGDSDQAPSGERADIVQVRCNQSLLGLLQSIMCFAPPPHQPWYWCLFVRMALADDRYLSKC